MQRVETIDQLRRVRGRLEGTVGFVPTLGFLHKGHLALMRRALDECDHLIVSVFVNPTQFGPGEDLEDYPRDLEGDAAKCRDVGCEILFTPERDHIYADNHCSWVEVKGLTDGLCGARRPGHFRGVATIVTKLFNVVDPDVAVFGRKDYQQLAVIRKLVCDLNFDIEIIGVDTVREDDGLATSSRNRYLDDQQRCQATSLAEGLVAAQRAYQQNPDQSVAELLDVARERIEGQPHTEIDYLECVHPVTLQRLDEAVPVGEDGAVIATAVFLGDARLIDNLRVDQPLPEGPLRRL